MRFITVFSFLLFTTLTACDTKAPDAAEAPAAPKTKMTGANRDAHGCIPSAGYAWCEHTQQCERPWELAGKQQFAKTPEAFEKYCDNPAQ
jgi:hypothetical protein